MRRNITLALPVCTALILAACGVACGSAQEEERIESIDSADTSKKSVPTKRGQAQTPPGAGEGNIHSVIAKERARLRTAKRREGILTEERLYSVFDEELIIQTSSRIVGTACSWTSDVPGPTRGATPSISRST
jgi:hypothetical protein